MAFIPYGRQNIGDNDIRAVVRVLRSAWLTQGPNITEFEKKISGYVGSRYGVAVANGTCALHLAYLAAGIGPGDEIITTPNTFVATANAALYVGAKPVFCDIRLDTHNIDEKKIEACITKRTKAIVPVHFAGHPVEMNAILRIAKKHKLLVIEDAAHALGATYRKKKIGSFHTAMAEFSFHPVKTITTGEGGMITTNDKKYYQRLTLLRTHGITKDAAGKNIMTTLGYNYRITDLQAALGTSQLKKVHEFANMRRKVVTWYEEELANFKDIILPQELSHVRSSWHLYVIKTRKPHDRDPLYTALKKKDIGVNFHYPLVYHHPFYRKLGYGKKKLTNAELYAKTCITLPLHTLMTRAHVKYIASAIKAYYRR